MKLDPRIHDELEIVFLSSNDYMQLQLEFIIKYLKELITLIPNIQEYHHLLILNH